MIVIISLIVLITVSVLSWIDMNKQLKKVVDKLDM